MTALHLALDAGPNLHFLVRALLEVGAGTGFTDTQTNSNTLHRAARATNAAVFGDVLEAARCVIAVVVHHYVG